MDAPAPRTADGHPDFSGVWDRGEPFSLFRALRSVVTEIPYQPWAAELAKQREASGSVGHPDAHCLPLHPVQLHTHPYPRKIEQTPTEVIVMYEANGGLRQFFLDGRALPKVDDDVQPWWYGYSVAHWDGDVLVVESTGFRDDSWLDEGSGAPGTSALKLTERITRPVYGRLEISITIDDPKAYTKPFGFKITQALMPDTQLIEYICAENEQSVKHFK